jgi:ribose transport system substrate-binding protein
LSTEVENRYFVEAAAKALDVLESFNGVQEELSISEIVRRVGVTYCSAFRLLYTLEKRGYVTRAAPSKRFKLTPVRKRFRIGYAGLGSDCPYSKEISHSMVLAARAYGIELSVRDNEFSPPTVLANLNALLEERVHLVIEHQWSESVADRVAKRCRTAGVPLIAIDFVHPDAYYFGADHHLAGKLSGQFLSQSARRRDSEIDKLLVLPPRGTGPTRKAYLTGLKEGLQTERPFALQPDVVTPSGCSSSDGYRAAKQALQQSVPARRVLIAAATDAFAIGSGRAALKTGLGPDVAIVGLGGGHDGRDHVLRGESPRASVACFPETYGERVISLALRILQGEQAPTASYTEHAVLTTANVDQYYPEAAFRRPRTLQLHGNRLFGSIECAS